MKLFKQKLKEGDKVECIINLTIKGEITTKGIYHGMYLYTLKVKDRKEFTKWLGVSCLNVKFLDWQLRKIK